MSQERAVLAGGCFWGMQDLIRRYEGVISTRVGYTGGDVPNASYRNHGTHAEAIEITFDPTRLSYRDILEFFFQIHDPTTLNRQGNDVGLSYVKLGVDCVGSPARRWARPSPRGRRERPPAHGCAHRASGGRARCASTPSSG